jgi:LuxR family maltose regulon positive regulatory protein
MIDPPAASDSAWMWVGKLAPPQMQTEAIAARSALLARLKQHRHLALALVISPPGFGKTTLLSQWRAELQGDPAEAPVAWLSLDEADSDVNRFLAYLMLALEGAGVDLGALSQRAHSQSMDDSPERTLAGLLQAMRQGGRRVTLMLDDYHRAAGSPIDDIVLTLLERGSEWLRLVIACRSRPRWPLATLKARGLLHEIEGSHLALSLSEASQVMGPGFDKSALAIVHSRTEGWAVALQLARLWFERGSGSSYGLQAFSGRVTEVTEYLAEQVIDDLPDECREFLVETSLLERFNAELADVVRGRTDSAAILARLRAFDALLVPLDASRTWFRYHRMLADFLRVRLDVVRADQIHRAAAAWLARQADWVLAVDHALKASDTGLAVSLVQQAGGWELVLRKGIQYTRSLLNRFDDLSRRTVPELLLMQSYLHAKLGDEPLAMELLRLAEVGLTDSPALRRDFKVTEALVHVYFDQLERITNLPTSADAANQLSPADPIGQATLLCAGAVSSLAWGRMDDAIQAARAAQTRMRVVASPLGENYCLIHVAQALAVQGNMAESRQKIDEALALADANFGTDSSLKALVGCFKAQHLYWQGQWVEAGPLVRAGQDTLEHLDGWLDIFAATAEVTWRVALRQEGLHQALAILDSTAHLARRRSLSRLARLVHAWRVDVLAQCGLIAQAKQGAMAASLESQLSALDATTADGRVDWRFLEAGSLALARISVGDGAAAPAMTRLERAAGKLRISGLLLPAWRLELLASIVKRRAHGKDLASAEIQETLAPFLRHGLTGLLLEAGPAVLPILQQMEGALPPAMVAVLTPLRGWQTHPPRHRAQFSAKESEVLTLLVSGQPNKTIARALDVSENTVKFHLKQIFQKLAVDNRSAAIAAALQQGFMPPPTRF